MSTTTSNSKFPAPTPAAPPSAAEVQRKLSMHAQSPPSHKRKGSLSKSPVIGPAAPALDLGNDISALNASPSYGGISPQEPSSSQHIAAAQGPLATQMAQLSVIAERPGGSAEETDDDDDDDWNPMEGRSLEELNTLNDECAAKEGYLYKKGERRKTWKKRWFVLRQTQLSYYKTNKEYKLLRLLPLSEVHCVTPVTLKRHDHAFGIVTPTRTYYVQAESAAEADSWVRALNEAKARSNSGSGGAAQEGRRNVPPTINIQRSTPMNILGSEPRTPPPQGYSGSPSSPSHHQQMTSSDSEDPDSYAPASPTTGPSQGQSFGSQMGTTPSSMGTAGPLSSNKVIVQGYLMKCGAKRKTWRKRWFVLTPEKLLYAKNHMDLNTGKQHKAKAASGAQHGSPNKRQSRRDMGGSSSSSPPQGEFVIPPSQPSGIRKDATSLTGAAATAMAA
ncbi:hypothetical protein FRC00_008330 [Tulasnella sp. 408]|nr:hypothetical protein FRC00_008330 [Tulasnella sp. 408]